MASDSILLEIANLEIDAKIGKDRHFTAASRKNTLRVWLGLFSVIGTALIASKVIKDSFQIFPEFITYESILISAISLLVGVSTSILGFLGLEKQVTQHRYVGNLYIEVARKARRLINRIYEGENEASIPTDLTNILNDYLNANKEGESCPTSNKDSKKSMHLNAASRAQIKNKIKLQDLTAMKLHSSEKKHSLFKLTTSSLKIRIASLICYLNIIDEHTRKEYVKQTEIFKK